MVSFQGFFDPWNAKVEIIKFQIVITNASNIGYIKNSP
jgi:hypothetical protein